MTNRGIPFRTDGSLARENKTFVKSAWFLLLTWDVETRKIKHPDVLEHVFRLTNRALITLDSYREIMGELDVYQRYVDLSSRHRVKLRGPFIVIEGGLSREESRRVRRTQKTGSRKLITLVDRKKG